MVETLNLNGNPVSTVGEYEYDGDGKRVKKHVPATGEVTVFVYDAGGKLIGEYSTVAAPQSPKVSYTTADHLGSPRILTDENGTTISRRDFMPYGEEIARTAYGSDTVRQKFTTYERDGETDLDFAQARIYRSILGRFSSADRIFLTVQRPSSPQEFNLYIYVQNNPLAYVDPSGNLLRATGSELWRYLRDLEAIIGVNLSVNEQGFVEINSPLPNDLSPTALQLIEIITNPFFVVDIEATRDRADVFIGQFLGGGRQIIDYGDIDKVTGQQGFSARSIVAHETIEAYSGLLNNVPAGGRLNERDHHAGIDAENDVRTGKRGDALPPRTKGAEGWKIVPDPLTGKMIRKFWVRFGDYEQIITQEVVAEGSGTLQTLRPGPIVRSEIIYVGEGRLRQ